MDEFELPVKIKAELRTYQKEWVSLVGVFESVWVAWDFM